MDGEIIREEVVEEIREANKGGGGEDEKIKNGRVGSRNFSLKKLLRFNSFDVEAGIVERLQSHNNSPVDWLSLLKLAFQSIGVVYGDLGTSPLYTLPGIFQSGIKHRDDLLGAYSLIFYALTLITLIKYAFIVLSANDNGEGGTFALYSLICRHAKVSLIPTQQVEDNELSNYRLEAPNRRLSRASKVKSMIEKSHFAKMCLLLMTMLGTSMIIGDGILTPCISVLSSVQGIRVVKSSLTDTTVMWISAAILFVLFQFQRFGTQKVGYSFAPILTTWFMFIAGIGVYNFFKYDPSIIKAINPMYIVYYFKRSKKEAWLSLGGVILCLTGSEALFADLGHFSVHSIQISTCLVVYPSVLLAYTGQVSYLREHMNDVSEAFYKSVPVLASIIASQALISASYSIVQQSLALGCFPRVKVMHTSTKYKGQVYIPDINYLLMIACIGVTLGFKDTTKIGNAYGLAVVFVMTLTSALLVLLMVMIWKTHILFIIIYVATIYLFELLILSAVLFKFVDGGYLPLAFSGILMGVMYTWNYVYRKKYFYELENKVTVEKLEQIASDPSIKRIPGVGVFYSTLVHGISPIFTHYVENVPALHTVLVFTSIKSVPISEIPIEERFLFRRISRNDLCIFQCVVRYGYKDARRGWDSFGEMLVERLKQFVREEEKEKEMKEKELQVIEDEFKNDGVTCLIGESEAVPLKGSSLAKTWIINYFYHFLRKVTRRQEEMDGIPYKRLLKVGMTYEL
ncbi:hypothetical protein Syun_030850 [Stephania yunnanensis]|uniref:Potassium transporter n=1 Tax=Stephania yunnanensis TaxID=152371 RepID=A0AAP0HEA6_9MAGN